MINRNLKLGAGIAIGVIAVSWAAIFIRLAEAPALVIATYRMVFASIPLLLLVVIRSRGELRGHPARTWWLVTAAGAALALHFATWVASLDLTTVASSVALVTTQPVWVVLMAWAVLHERIGVRGALGIAVAMAGGLIIAGVDVAISGRALVGDALALAGAVLAGIYFVIGRTLLRTMTVGTYIAVVYGSAAVMLAAVTAVARQPFTGYSATTWSMFLLLALIPQIVGHSLLNWSLRYVSPAFVSVSILGEPVFSTLLAIPILGEWPGPIRVAGAVVTVAGVYLAMGDETTRTGSQRTAEVDVAPAG